MCWCLNDPPNWYRDFREDQRLFTPIPWLLETCQLKLESLEHRNWLLPSLPTWGSSRTIGSLSCCLLAQDEREENVHLQGHNAKQTKCLAHRKHLCPCYQPCSHLWSTTFLPVHATNHKGQFMSTNVSKILCSALVYPWSLVLKWLFDKTLMFLIALNVKLVAGTWVWPGGEE